MATPHTVPDAQTQTNRLIQNATANAAFWGTQAAGSVDRALEGAAAAGPAYAAGVQAAVQKGSFTKGIAKVDKAAMAKTIQASTGSYSQGIANRADKILASRQRLVPLQQAVVNKIASMPKGTKQQAKDRMNANFDAQVALKDAYRG
jgi:hypothetical protein